MSCSVILMITTLRQQSILNLKIHFSNFTSKRYSELFCHDVAPTGLVSVTLAIVDEFAVALAVARLVVAQCEALDFR